MSLYLTQTNICSLIKGITEPEGVDCIQLNQLTELIISPKDRQKQLSKTSISSNTSAKQPANQSALSSTAVTNQKPQATSNTNLSNDNSPVEHTANGIAANNQSTNHRSSLRFNSKLQNSSGINNHSSSNAQLSEVFILFYYSKCYELCSVCAHYLSCCLYILLQPSTSQTLIYDVLRRLLPSFLTPENSPTEVPEADANNYVADRTWGKVDITPVTARVLTTQQYKSNSK